MAMAVQPSRPRAPVPLILGVLRRLEVAPLVDGLIPLHPEHVVSAGRGGEALVRAILAGDQALSTVGHRLEERGRLELLQPGLPRAALHEDRLGHMLEALCAAHLNKGWRAVARKALAV